MRDQPLYRSIVSGETGLWAAPLRGVLALLEPAYRCVVALRNRKYERPASAVNLPVPVISVGNLTVGGTGKTPFAIELVRRLDAMGCSPAVVARGYGVGLDERGDEERLVRARCPGVAYIADKDRVWGAQTAADRFHADVIVLDDGFQHRRLHRDLDFVLIDATCPFGYGRLLPRGLLREPLMSLRRAHGVFLTRSDQVSERACAELEARLRELAPDAAHVRCVHKVIGLERLDGSAVKEPLHGKRVLVFAGIAHPQAFLTTVRTLGVEVVGRRWWPDHHRYKPRDLRVLTHPHCGTTFDFLLTTEKDAVKLAELGGAPHLPIYVVKVGIDFVAPGDTMLRSLLERVVPRRRNPSDSTT